MSCVQLEVVDVYGKVIRRSRRCIMTCGTHLRVLKRALQVLLEPDF